MPSEIIIVRHGLCTGNVAERASSKGDHTLFTEVLRKQESGTWPLTPQGVLQARMAGQFIRSEFSKTFDRYFCSNMLRASQTAIGLGFVDSSWETNLLLRERSWGGLESISNPERIQICLDQKNSPVEDSIEWRPPNGESMREVIQRIALFMKRITHECAGKRLLIVSHGAPIQALRVIQHNITDAEYPMFISGGNYIRNCHVFRFSAKKSVGSFRIEQSAFLNADGSWNRSTQELN